MPTDLPATDAAAPSRCPVDHRAMAAAAAAHSAPPSDQPAVCPFPHQAGERPVHRTKADMFVRRLLRIKERPPGVSAATAYSAFQKSMLISGTRCTLTYVVFPFVLPLLALSPRVGGFIGVVIGSVALVSDVFTIRRFFAVDHKYRWYFSAVALSVICLMVVLLVEDFASIT